MSKNPESEGQGLVAHLPQWVQASVLVIALSMLGKVFGLIRELESARIFGVGVEMDAFIAASTLIFFVARMASDSFLMAVSGTVGEYDTRHISIPWGDLLRAIWFLSILLALLSPLFLPSLIPVLFSGLAETEQHLARRLLMKMLPITTGWAIIGAFGGILNAQGRYGRYQSALMVANVGILLTLWASSHWLGISALAWGWSVGISLGALALATALWEQLRQMRTWRGWRPQWNLLKRLLIGTGGVSLWFVLNQIPLWVERHYGARLVQGSLSALGYAQRLFQLPLEMVTAVVMSVWLERVVKLTPEKVAGKTLQLMGNLALVSFPASLVLSYAARPIVTLVYARGAFSVEAIDMTTGPFAAYALGLGFHTLSAVLVRTFQARRLTRYPLFAVLLDIALTILLNQCAFRMGWGATGIAAINSTVAALRSAILAVALLKSRPRAEVE